MSLLCRPKKKKKEKKKEGCSCLEALDPFNIICSSLEHSLDCHQLLFTCKSYLSDHMVVRLCLFFKADVYDFFDVHK